MDLLERDEQLTTLRQAMSDSVSGQGRVVLVSGEAGIGKTALTRAFLDTVEREGPRAPRILRGSCENLSVAEPLAPLYDLARDAGWQAPSALDGGEGRLRLFSDALSEFSSWPPGTVLVIEDLHWADEATLDFVRFLARRIPHHPVMLLATARSEATSAQAQLRRALGEMPPDAVIRVPLPPLSRDAVSKLAGEAGRDAHAVWQAAGGNAFFVTELLQSDEVAPSPSVKDAVLARVDRLSDGARAVLDVAAVFPRRAEVDLIQSLIGHDIEDGIEECLDHGLLDHVGGYLIFRHELARQASEDALRASHRRRLNAQIYEVLTTLGGAPARRLHHAQAAQNKDAIRALAPLAAKGAEAAGARREAAEYYRVAVDAIGDDAEIGLLEDAAMANYLVGRYDSAIQFQTAAQRHLADSGDTLRQGDGWRRISRFRWTSGDIIGARADADTAIEILKGHESAELALAYANLSQLRMLAYAGEDVSTPAEKAIALAEVFDRPDITAQATQNISGSLIYSDFEKAKRLMQRAIDLALDAGDEETAARAMVNMPYIYWWLFLYEEGRVVSKKYEPYSLEKELDGYHDYHAGTLALIELELGHLDEAEYWIHRTTAPPEKNFQGWQQFPGTVAHARWRFRTGQADDPIVADYLSRYLERAKESQRLAPIAELNAERAWVGGADPASAISDILAVIDLAPRSETIAYMRVWLHRLGAGHLDAAVNEFVPEPHRSELLGDARRAADLWGERKAPYNQAFALAFAGDARSREKAAEIFESLGAHDHAKAALGKRRSATQPLDDDPSDLTRRQMDVLRHLAEGKTNAQIGEVLFISAKTVDHHVSAILGKLGASNRGEAAALAREAGLIQ